MKNATPKKGGILSEDGAVGVYPKGKFSKLFGGYSPVQYESLIRKGNLIGDGKNWFEAARFDALIGSLKGTACTIMMRKNGNSPAIIEFEGVEAVVAPLIE